MTAEEKRETSELHAAAAELELLGGLLATTYSGWDLAKWKNVLRHLLARERRVVVLRVLHGMGNEEIAKRLYVCKGRVDQLWQRALTRLALILSREEL